MIELFENFSIFINNIEVFLIIISAIMLYLAYDKKLAFVYMLGLILLTIFFKYILFQERVCTSSLVECPATPSFPSGHAMLAFGTALFFYKRKYVFLSLIFFSILVMLSRLYLGVHSFNDIAGSVSLSLFYFSVWWKNGKL